MSMAAFYFFVLEGIIVMLVFVPADVLKKLAVSKTNGIWKRR